MNADVKKEILLEAHDLSVVYGGVTALDGVSISVAAGEIVALMGPNGAGKSTILKSVFGMAPLARGTIAIDGHEVTPVPHEMVRRGITFVPQGRRVFSSLSVEENLEMGGFSVNNTAERGRRRDEMYGLFPALREKRRMRAGTLSGGQQQMLAVARGLMTRPRLLMLDEPTLGLTPKLVREVCEMISSIRTTTGTAILVVEHNLKTLFSIIDRAIILERGKVALSGTPSELLHIPLLQRIFLGAEV